MKPEHAIGLLVLLLIGAALAESTFGLVNISHNQTYIFNYTNATNETGNESFFCAAPNTCPVNASFIRQNITMALAPGELEIIENTYCRVSASCDSCQAQSNTTQCIIDRDLNPGSTYVNNDGACRVRIEVDEDDCDEDDFDRPNVRQVESFSVFKDEIGIHFTLGNQTFNIPDQVASFTYEGEVEMLCPANVDLAEEHDKDKLLDLCATFAPILVADWIAPTLESCRNTASEHLKDVKDCSTETANLHEEIAQLNADKTGLQATIQAQETTTAELRMQLDGAGRNSMVKNIFLWLQGIFNLILLVITIILSIVVIRRRD